MKKFLNRFFNWKKHPTSVFYVALPLFIIGVCALFARAVLELVWNGDPVYLIIDLLVVVAGAIALWPIREQILKALLKE